MAWQQTPYTVPIVAAAISSFLLAVYAWRHYDYTGSRSLTALTGSAAWWSAFYAVGLANSTLAVKLAAFKVMYLGVVVVPVAWLLFAVEYTGRFEKLRRRQIALMFVIPAVTVGLLWTNGAHGLMWRTVELVTHSGNMFLSVTHGAWFWIWAAFSYLLLAIGTLLVVQMAILGDHVYRGQAVALTVAVLVPWGANALFLSGLTGPWDPTNLGIVFSGAILVAAINREQLLEVVPVAREVARDEVIETMSEGVIVVDELGRVVDVNPAAEAIIDRSAPAVIGEPIDEVLWTTGDLSNPTGDSIARDEITLLGDGTDRTYDVRRTPLRRGYGTITGQLITLRDVTDRKERERRLEHQRQRLEVINRVLSHDIRNAMNVVLWQADDLLTSQQGEPHANQIKEKAEEIIDLSRKALRLERIVRDDTIKRRATNVVEIVEREVAEVRQTYPAAEVQIDAPERAEVQATDYVNAAIRSVLENAVEHNDQPTPRVTVTITPSDPGTAEDPVEIAIADNGPGLPEWEQEVIETGTETALEHSSGLGLWLTYWIVKQSGGSIEFGENEPRGCVITIRLPPARAEE